MGLVDPTPPTPQRLDPPEPEALSGRLFPPLPTEAEWSLDRVRAVLDTLDRPHRSYPTLHVGGTNGKGSVAAVWDSVLRESGHRVGLYTSPHLLDFNERFRIAGRPASDGLLLDAAAAVRDPVVRHGLTFFEAVTVLAFHLFRETEVDAAVLEVGLGGRLDATNVIRPEVCAVTNVGLDHTEYLGGTRTAVAREKAGIAKAGVPFVTAERDPDVVAVLEREALARGARFHRLDPDAVIGEVDTGISGSRFRLDTRPWGALDLETRLVGRHQVENVALAVRALELMTGPLRPLAGPVVRGVAGARWPGRIQVEALEGRTWVFDVAHNPEGIRALSETLETLDLPEPLVVLFGCLGDKDWRIMLEALRPRARRAVLTFPPGAPPGRDWDPGPAVRAFPGWAEASPTAPGRRLSTEEGRDASTSDDPLQVETSGELAAALGRAESLTGEGGTVVVTGSHRLVGAALAALERRPFPANGGGTERDDRTGA